MLQTTSVFPRQISLNYIGEDEGVTTLVILHFLSNHLPAIYTADQSLSFTLALLLLQEQMTGLIGVHLKTNMEAGICKLDISSEKVTFFC